MADQALERQIRLLSAGGMAASNGDGSVNKSSSISRSGHRSTSPIPVAVLMSAIRLGDFAALILAGLLASVLMQDAGLTVDIRPQLLVIIAATSVSYFALNLLGAYRHAHRKSLASRLVTRAVGIAAGAPAAVICILLLPSERALLPLWPVTWVMLSAIALTAGHTLAAAAISQWNAAGRLSRRVVVVGNNDFSAGFLDRVARHPEEGFEVVGVYSDGHDDKTPAYNAYPISGRIEDIVSRSQRERIDAVVLAIPLTQPDRIQKAKQRLASIVADVYLTTGLAGLQFQARELQDLAATPMVRVQPRPLDHWQALQKAAFDRVFAAGLLIVLSLALLVIAVLIKLDSPGPVLFRQPRLGFNNLLFTVYKFRTMHHGSADLLAEQQTRRGDNRITRVGRILRKLSLDELPQLFNVLNGSMSLVGPRPHAPNTKAGDVLFHDAVAEYALRHRVKPGITGWAQVNGWRGETRTVQQIEQRVAHDLYYIDNWSLALDIRIIALTLVREINSDLAF